MTHRMCSAFFAFVALISPVAGVFGNESPPAQEPSPRVDAAPPKKLEITQTGLFDLAPLRDQKTLSIQMVHSPTLSADLESTLRALGFQIVPYPRGDVVLTLFTTFGAQKMQLKPLRVDYAQAYEAGVQSVLANQTSHATQSLDLGADILALQGNITPHLLVGFDIFDMIATVTGVKSWANKLVSGDERGLCIFNCERFNSFAQQMLIATRVGIKGQLTDPHAPPFATTTKASALDERLLPNELFQIAMKTLTAQLLPHGVGPIETGAGPQGAPATSLDAGPSEPATVNPPAPEARP